MRQFKTNEYGEVLMDRTDIKRLDGKQDGTIFCSFGTGFVSQENWKDHFLPLILGLPDLVNAAAEILKGTELIGYTTCPCCDEDITLPINDDKLSRLSDALAAYEKLL